MDRRSFLKGTFGGVVAGGVIVAASDADVAQFATGVTPDSVVSLNPQYDEHAWAQLGHVVYNHRGEPIGVVHDIQMNHDAVDVSTFHSPYQVKAPGLRTVIYTVVADGFLPRTAVNWRTK